MARSLKSHFILASLLLVVTTLVGGVWCAWTFARLSREVDQMLQQSEETVALTATLSHALEREDDAVLLAVGGDTEQARRELAAQRKQFDESFTRLLKLVSDRDEREEALRLRRHADDYTALGDAIVAEAGSPAARERYREAVNPALRRAVASCARIRELNFLSMQQAGVRARDETARSTVLVLGICAAALTVSTIVLIRLSRAVVVPIRALTQSVEALRQGTFDERVPPAGIDELRRLGDGFNKMAETLTDYRNSSLGELLRAKTALESTLTALPEGVIVLDPEGRVVSTNRLSRDFLQASGRHDARTADELPVPANILRAVHDVLRNGGGDVVRTELNEALAVAMRGRTLRMLLTVAPIPEFLPHRCGAVVLLDDVTELARLDELRAELVAVASHELKTPLTALRMNLLLLAERAENLDERQREMLAAALVGTDELSATIDELLDLTRIEAGQLRIQQDRVNVRAVVDAAVRTARPRYEGAEIGLCVENDGGALAVRGDAPRLRAVLANLLGNALKYTPRGGQVVVGVGFDAEARSLRIDVSDTGPGVPEEFRTRVFDKFFRVEHHVSNGSQGVRGTGIGLYLCRQIVEAHGGRIWCEPGADGRGARFSIRLTMEP